MPTYIEHDEDSDDIKMMTIFTLSESSLWVLDDRLERTWKEAAVAQSGTVPALVTRNRKSTKALSE
jgi:hypothetical protein